MAPKTEKRVVLARRVARRWVRKVAHPEYRLRILYGTREIRNLPSLLRSFRDGRVAMEGMASVPDLGVKESFDALEVWSADRNALVKVQDWFEKRGFETTGIW